MTANGAAALSVHVLAYSRAASRAVVWTHAETARMRAGKPSAKQSAKPSAKPGLRGVDIAAIDVAVRKAILLRKIGKT